MVPFLSLPFPSTVLLFLPTFSSHTFLLFHDPSLNSLLRFSRFEVVRPRMIPSEIPGSLIYTVTSQRKGMLIGKKGQGR
jgi:hypothetical protein